MKRFLSKRELMILYITLGIILSVIIFNLFFAPVLTKNDALNKEIKLSREKLNKYQRLLGQKEYIEKKFKMYSVPNNELRQKADPLVNALVELENLAKNSNIRIIDMRPKAAKEVELYHEILIDLRLEGNIEGYFSFIYNLENSLTMLRIKSFQLTATTNPQLLEGSFSISQISE